MLVLALALLAEVSDSFVQELGQSGLVLHFHGRWQVVVPFEDLVIGVLEERALVVVLLHENVFCLLGIVGCVGAEGAILNEDLLVAHLPPSLDLLPLQLVLPVLFLRFPDPLELSYLPQLKLVLFVNGVIIVGNVSLILELGVCLLIFLF